MKRSHKFVIIVAFVLFLLVVMAEKIAKQQFIKTHKTKIITVEVGDLIFRSNSTLMAGSSFYKNSGMPGHVAVVLSEGSFFITDENMGDIKVAEARFFDHSKRKFARSVGINFARENFGSFSGRRLLLRSRLTHLQKEQLLQFTNQNLGKPYRLIQKNNTQSSYNCATFVQQAIYNATGINIDGNQGAVIFPNDILKSSFYGMNENTVLF